MEKENYFQQLGLKIKRFFQLIFKIGRTAFREPYKYNILKAVLDGEPYDYSYLLEIERAKLIEMRDYFFHSNIAVDDMQVSKEINLAIKMLDIMSERSKQLFHFEDPYPDEPKDDMWKEREDGSYELNSEKWDRHHKYVCDVKVNTRNASRFVNKDVVQYYEKYPADLYFEKARHLYHLIREHLEETWSN